METTPRDTIKKLCQVHVEAVVLEGSHLAELKLSTYHLIFVTLTSLKS